MNTAGDVGSGREHRYIVGDDGQYVPGQHECRIIDPRPKRDHADLAAVLTFVDDDRMACSVVCLRCRDTGWRAISVQRSTPHTIGRSSCVAVPPLQGDLLAFVESAAGGHAGFPFEPPSRDEASMRRLAHGLLAKVRSGEAS